MKNGSQAGISIRILMQGKEVGCIIGKKGETVKRFRTEMGVNVAITPDSSPERIVSISGNMTSVGKVLSVICESLEKWYAKSQKSRSDGWKPPITLKLLIPSSQCGTFIGKGGSHIKEMRGSSGASIQVSPDVMPASTERIATIAGNAESLSQALQAIIETLAEAPIKGDHIFYKPMPAYGSMGYSDASRYNMDKGFQSMTMSTGQPMHRGSINKSDLEAIITSHIKTGPKLAQEPIKHSILEMPERKVLEVSVPNDLVGCIIGRGGSKIAEIRHASGANVDVSRPDPKAKDGKPIERTVTISGTPEAVKIAHYLVKMSIEYQKAVLEGKNIKDINELSQSDDLLLPDLPQISSGCSASASTSTSAAAAAANSLSNITSNAASLANILPLAQLLEQPHVLTYLKSLSVLTGLNEVIGNISNNPTGNIVSKLEAKPPANNSNISSYHDAGNSVGPLRYPNERSRYNPY